MSNLNLLPHEGAIDPMGRTYLHGKWWDAATNRGEVFPMPRWVIEREIFTRSFNKGDMSFLPGFLSAFEHYKLWVTEIWGRKDSIWPFEWNPNAERIIRKKMDERILMMAGHASSGKSEILALWAVTNFLISPFNTKVLVTSVSLKSSRGKIWGSVSECWQQAGSAIAQSYGVDPMAWESCLPAKLLQQGIIKYCHEGTETEKAGLELIAGDVAKAKDSASKVIGYKRERIIGILDEVATLDQGLVNTFFSNIKANPFVDITGAFNPDSYFDPAGKLCKPVGGWGAISEDSDNWRAESGAWVERFDGLKAPNVIEGWDRWKGLLTKARIEEEKINLGEKSKQFYSMYRGFWSPTGALDCIYTEPEILSWMCDKKVDGQWLSVPTPCAFIDPSFSITGDRAIAVFGKVGQCRVEAETRTVLQIEEVNQLDKNITEGDKTAQLAFLYMDECKKRGIQPEHAGCDVTGSQFYTVLSAMWSPRVYQLNFGAAPSDKRATKAEGPAKNHYMKRVDEIWWAPKALMRSGQIKGLTVEIIEELAKRSSGKDAQQKEKIKVEPKDKMRERTGKSPDIGDAFCGLVDLARHKLGLSPTERPKVDLVGGKNKTIKSAYEKAYAALQDGLSYAAETSAMWK